MSDPKDPKDSEYEVTTNVVTYVIPPSLTDTAMRKLLEKHNDKILWGCYYAVQIALKKDTVHSREVRDRMFKEGLIGEGKEFWLGTVFHTLKEDGVLKHDGHWYKYSDPERGIHERTVKIWCLDRKAVLLPKYLEPPRV